MIKAVMIKYNQNVSQLISTFSDDVRFEIKSITKNSNVLEIDLDDCENTSVYISDSYSDIQDFVSKISKYVDFEFSKNVTKEFNNNELVYDKEIYDEDIEEYYINNVNINDVLDKINEFGIGSLNKIDKAILENF
jgi:hypothetical protein